MPPMRVVTLSGSPYEMGRQHGAAYAGQIRELAEERIELSGTEKWAGRVVPRAEIMALGEACLALHQAYAPELMDELRGISDVTGVGLPELVILNGFTDFIDVVYNARAEKVARPAHPAADNCTAFIVSAEAAAEGHGFFGQTWDMHATATPFVVLLHGQPAGGLRFLTLTIIGCVGMIGMNEAGIAIGINNLMSGDGQVGVTWPFVVRKVLAQDNLDDALACITSATLSGGHNYLLADASGRGFNVEAMSTRCEVTEVTDGSLVHTNHCLAGCNIDVERERLPESRLSSVTRLSRAEQMLRPGRITLDDLFALTRDHGASSGICVHPTAPLYMESCAATIMRPATGEMWATWGPPCQNAYERFVV
ncbi:MAG: C45 family autoproteolytic acyltransferase/hydolase [Anaerolineae bacterium]